MLNGLGRKHCSSLYVSSLEGSPNGVSILKTFFDVFILDKVGQLSSNCPGPPLGGKIKSLCVPLYMEFQESVNCPNSAIHSTEISPKE